MPTPPKVPFSHSLQATFTDREQPQQYFKEALAGINQHDYSLLNFYGVGGIGKSRLHHHLQEAHLDKDKNYLYSGVNFEVPDSRNLHKTLTTLVHNFKADVNIPFVAFGLAYIIYWEKAFPYQDIKKAGLPFLEEGGLLAGAADILAGGILSPIVGATAYAYDKFKAYTFSDDLRDALNQLKPLKSEQIEEQLPQFFVYDIQQYQQKHPDKKIVIFIDTHEALWEAKRTEANRLSQDQWLRDGLIARLPKVLFVISGREKIIWDEDTSDNWGDYLQNCQHLLGSLSDDDARDFLKSCDINEPDIQDKIIADSEGVPFYLDLCMEIYNKIRQQDKTPTAKDFSNVAKDKLFERFMRYLDLDELETLKVLAHARFYTAELFGLLVEKFKTGYPISAMSQLNNFSFIRQDQGQFYIHDLMRKSLLEHVQQQESDKSGEIFQFLFDHYNEQQQKLEIKGISEASLNALPEAFYYKARLVSAEELFDWFKKPRKILMDAAQYKPVLEINLKLKQIIEDELGQDHLYGGYVLHNLAGIYNQIGKYEEAEPLYQRSLSIMEKALGKDHPSVATTLNNLAGLYKAQGKYEEAEPLYKRSLSIMEKALGKDPPSVATTLNNLAGLYKAQGKYEEAEPLYKRSLSIYEKALGKDHPLVATTLNNLAGLYRQQGKYEEAEPLYKRDLSITEKALGKDHPLVATTLNNLAELYRQQGKYEEAEPLYKRSLEITEKALGKDHPSVAETLNNLAVLYKSQGKYEEAKPLYKRSLSIKEKALGKDHPSVAITLNNIAMLYGEQKKYKEALPLFERSLAILKAKFPNGHPHIDVMQGNIDRLKSEMN